MLFAEDGKYYVDFKNGSGDVGKGDPPSGPADVTIKMNNANFLKIFNREFCNPHHFFRSAIKEAPLPTIPPAPFSHIFFCTVAESRKKSGGRIHKSHSFLLLPRIPLIIDPARRSLFF